MLFETILQNSLYSSTLRISVASSTSFLEVDNGQEANRCICLIILEIRQKVKESRKQAPVINKKNNKQVTNENNNKKEHQIKGRMTILSAGYNKLRHVKTAMAAATILGGGSTVGMTMGLSTTSAAVASNLNIKIIPNNKLYVSEPNPSWFGNGPNPTPNTEASSTWTNANWLKSRFHFSFAEYHNSNNLNFGVLRVMNDDLVQPQRGFGTHPHGDMEIITYIVDGELTHKDSMGTEESLGRGSIQFMTAGTGVRHSEYNHGDRPLRFIQTWIVPSQRGLKPNYGSYKGPADGTINELLHLVSPNEENWVSDDSSNTNAVAAPVQVNQDVNVYASELELGQTVSYKFPSNEGQRQAYLLCIEGSLNVNGKQLSKYDGCEITQTTTTTSDDATLEITATDVEDTEHGKVAHFLMFTMKHVPGSGRKDL